MRKDRVPLGVGDDALDVPSHVCFFHDGEEELRSTQLAFLRPAIDDPRQAVLLFGPSGAAEQLLSFLEADLGRTLSGLVLAYRVVLAEGDEDPDLQLENLVGPLRNLVEAGHELVRVVGRVAWQVPNYPPPADFLWYESRITPLVLELPVAVLCAYDTGRLPGEALAHGGLECHPQILMGGKISPSPSYVPPEQFLSRRLVPMLNESGASR
jgi:hypothetical protein